MIFRAAAFGLALGGVFAVFQLLEEQQIRELLDGIQRIGEPAGPEFIPEGVDLRAEFWIGDVAKSLQTSEIFKTSEVTYIASKSCGRGHRKAFY